MRVVVDTSVWSLSLRRQSQETSPEARALEALISSGQTILMLGIILQEILQGVRKPEQFQRLKSSLAVFPLVEPTRDIYEYAAELFNICRSEGIQIATVDCLIASATIQSDSQLFTADKDFLAIARFSPLRLFQVER